MVNFQVTLPHLPFYTISTGQAKLGDHCTQVTHCGYILQIFLDHRRALLPNHSCCFLRGEPPFCGLLRHQTSLKSKYNILKHTHGDSCWNQNSSPLGDKQSNHLHLAQGSSKPRFTNILPSPGFKKKFCPFTVHLFLQRQQTFDTPYALNLSTNLR